MKKKISYAEDAKMYAEGILTVREMMKEDGDQSGHKQKVLDHYIDELIQMVLEGKIK